MFDKSPDDKVRRYLVYLKYWALNLRPLMAYPKVLYRPNFIILRQISATLVQGCQKGLTRRARQPVHSLLKDEPEQHSRPDLKHLLDDAVVHLLLGFRILGLPLFKRLGAQLFERQETWCRCFPCEHQEQQCLQWDSCAEGHWPLTSCLSTIWLQQNAHRHSKDGRNAKDHPESKQSHGAKQAAGTEHCRQAAADVQCCGSSAQTKKLVSRCCSSHTLGSTTGECALCVPYMQSWTNPTR